MRKFFTALIALFFSIPIPAFCATPSNPSMLGTAQTGSASPTTLDLVTTADAPAGSAIMGPVNLPAGATNLSVTDSVANTYLITSKFTASTAGSLWWFHADNPIDLPAPCTVTATETSTTLVVTAVVTCSSTDVLTVGQTISGGSFTGKISAPCTLVAGSATCTITGGSTVASPGTATISSTITASWTTGGHAGMGAVTSGGLATSGALDKDAGGNNTGTPNTSASITTPTLSQNDEIIFGRVDTAASTTGFTQTGFNLLTKITITSGNNEINWGWKIVSVNTAVTYATSWTTSRAFGTNAYAFQVPSSASRVCSMSLLGVC